MTKIYLNVKRFHLLVGKEGGSCQSSGQKFNRTSFPLIVSPCVGEKAKTVLVEFLPEAQLPKGTQHLLERKRSAR